MPAALMAKVLLYAVAPQSIQQGEPSRLLFANLNTLP